MDLIAIGRIRSAHGLKGFLKIMSFSGETDHFFSLENVYIIQKGSERQMIVEEVKPAGREILIKFKGIDNPENAKLFSGSEIFAEKNNAAPLKKGEFYHADLLHCNLIFNGIAVGSIVSIWNNGKKDYLEIKKKDGSVCMIPFIEQFIGNVDLDERTIILLNDELLQ